MSLDGRAELSHAQGALAAVHLADRGGPWSNEHISCRTVTLLVDADSYEPIEWRVSQDGKVAVTSFPIYERLPATDANGAQLSLTGRHSGAAIDDDPDHYRAALERLNPKLR